MEYDFFLSKTIFVLCCIIIIIWNIQEKEEQRRAAEAKKTDAVSPDDDEVVPEAAAAAAPKPTKSKSQLEVQEEVTEVAGDASEGEADSEKEKKDVSLWSSECSAQGQVFHCKLRHQGCSSAQRLQTQESGCSFIRDE